MTLELTTRRVDVTEKGPTSRLSKKSSEKGMTEKVHWRRLVREGSWEKVRRRWSVGKGPSKKVLRRKATGEGPSETVCWRRFAGEGPLEKVRGRRSDDTSYDCVSLRSHQLEVKSIPTTFPTIPDLPIGLSTCLTSLMH